MKTLIENGYREWQRDADRFGVKIQYQKRIDTVPEYEDYPLCECNDKLFININSYEYDVNGVYSLSFEMSLVHENRSGDWCDLRIYALTADKIEVNLKSYEVQLLEMWRVFYGQRRLT